MRTVVIVHDHAMFRAGVRSEIAGRVDVLAEADDVDSAVAAVLEHRPDVVLLDVHPPGGGGVEVMRRAAPRSPDTRFPRCRSPTPRRT
jgi:DNA-binding NarL/FixJ family response regulator